MADIEEGNAGPEPSPRTIEQPAVQAMPNVVEVRPPEESAAERQSPAPAASPRSEVSALSAGSGAGGEDQVVTLNEPMAKLTWWQFYFTYADWIDVAMMLLGTAGGMATGALIPYFQFLFGKMLDSLNTGKGIVEAVNAVAIEFGYISAVAFVAGVAQVMGWGVNGERQGARVRGLYVKGILRQDISWFDLQTRGQTASLVADLTATFQDGMGRKNGDVAEYVTQFVGGFVIAFLQSWKLTLVLLCAIPAVAWATAMLAMLTSRAQKKGTMAYAAAGSKAYEALSSIRTVQALRLQDRVMNGYSRLLREAELMGYSKARDNGLGIGLIGLVIYATFGLGFWYGSRLVADSVGCNYKDESCISGGKVLTCFFAVIMGAMGLGSAFPCMAAIVQAKTAAETIFHTIKRTPVIDSASKEGAVLTEAKGEIELKDVVFAYPTRPSKHILREYNLKIEAGKTLALVGPSGEGKSTIMSLVLRFYDPIEGRVTLDGRDFRSINLESLRSHIGYVGQEPVLLGATIRENILQGRPGASEDDMIAAAKMANAHQFISDFANGYDTFCGEGGKQLSGGQKQRIAIARALIKDPAILLLDEATSALDNKSEKEVQAALDKLQEYKRRTTIVIAHRLTTIRNADAIAFVKGGKVVELGSHQELMDLKGLYAAMVASHEAAPTDGQEDQSHDNAEDGPDAVFGADGDELAVSGAGGGPAFANRRKSSVASRRMSKASSIDESRRSAGGQIMRRKSSLLETITPVPDIELGDGSGKVINARAMLWKLALEEWDAFLVGLIGSMVNGAGFPVLGFLIARSQDMLYLRNPVRIRAQGEFWGGMFCLLGVVIFAARLSQEYGLGVMSERLARKLRLMAFGAMLRKRIAWFDLEENSTGALTTQLSEDAAKVNGVLGASLGQLLQLIFCLAISLGLAFGASWQMALLVLATLPLQIVGRMVQQAQMQGMQGQSADTGGASGAVLSTAVLGIRTVSAFNLQNAAHARYVELYQSTFATRLREAVTGGFLLGYTQVVQYGTNGLVFFVAGQLIDKGYDSFKDVIQSIMTLMLGTSGVAMALKGLGDTRKARDGAQRITSLIYSSENQTIDCMSDAGDKLNSFKGEIELSGVSFFYPNRPNQQIYGGPNFPKGYSLKIKAGESLALVGPSGGGKSTTMQLILRFYDPQAGKVLFDGVDIRTLNVKWLRSQISYVGQEPALLAGTIMENILNGNPSATPEAVMEAAKAANIHDFIMSLPQGYTTIVDEGSINLSGGQKQRIALARAFIGQPKVLLLDEATSALDNENERKVTEAVEQMQRIQKFTTITIAHRLSTIQKSDKIAVISGGGVVELGTHQELLALDGVYAQLAKQGQKKH